MPIRVPFNPLKVLVLSRKSRGEPSVPVSRRLRTHNFPKRAGAARRA